MRHPSPETLRRYAEMRVPRYTSYPTAAEFKPNIGVREQTTWLGALSSCERVSVYLHVPYCRQLCHYCGCNAKVAGRPDVVETYRRALETEIERTCDRIARKARVGRIHWGGGTPSILGADGLMSVLSVLRRRFDCDNLSEHAIELDPRYVTPDLAAALRDLGIDRASLGVQDIDPTVQRAIGRWQPFQVVRDAAASLRQVGIERLNFDLIYGMPAQTVDSLKATCQMVTRLSPDRIACYGYAHVPHMRANQRLIDVSMLPASGQRTEQADVIASELQSAGYVRVGIDHFAKPRDPLALAARAGRLRRNFQGYTDDQEPILLGFGASAISRFPQGYIQNVSDPPGYVRAIEACGSAACRGIRLTKDDYRRGAIIESLMCRLAADLDEFAPDQSFSAEMQELQPLIADKLVDMDGRLVRIAHAAPEIARVVASIFDPYMRKGSDRFSKAV